MHFKGNKFKQYDPVQDFKYVPSHFWYKSDLTPKGKLFDDTLYMIYIILDSI